MLIGGVAAFFFFNKNVSSYDGAMFSDSPLMTKDLPQTVQGYEVTSQNYKSIPYVQNVGNAGLPTATSSELKAIDIQAKASPNTVIYYPKLGIGTVGGQGYSTATPEKLVSKIITPTPAAVSSAPFKSQAISNAFKGKYYK